MKSVWNDRCFSYTCNVKYVTLFFACGVVISGKLKEERIAISTVYHANFCMMKWLGCEVA